MDAIFSSEVIIINDVTGVQLVSGTPVRNPRRPAGPPPVRIRFRQMTTTDRMVVTLQFVG